MLLILLLDFHILTLILEHRNFMTLGFFLFFMRLRILIDYKITTVVKERERYHFYKENFSEPVTKLIATTE